MKREWNKAVKELKKLSKGRPASLEYNEWVDGLLHKIGEYRVYIEGYGFAKGNTAMEAVINMNKLIKSEATP